MEENNQIIKFRTTQKNFFVLKALFKDPDAAHVINNLDLTIK